MEILANSTPFQVGLAVATDKLGHEHCVIVTKASFTAEAELAADQAPLIYADTLDADADFAPFKPLTDVIVIGKAVAPGGVAVTELPVRLEVEGRSKDALVFGERRWSSTVGFRRASSPVPFTEMPLTWARAFGSPDHPHNPVGTGRGEELPNVEDPRAPIGSPRDAPRPRGFARIGRSWQPRAAFAGTYDRRWRTEVCPLLPEDFDDRYFQAAPDDQQFPHFRGGERIRCVHMATEPVVEFCVPKLTIRAHFDLGDHRPIRVGVLDTVVLEPHRRLMHLSWRCSIPLPKQLTRLRGVFVGEPPERDGPIGYRRGKPLFAGLGAYLRWTRR